MDFIDPPGETCRVKAAAPLPATIYEILAVQATRQPEGCAILAPGRAPASYHRLLELIEATVAQLNLAGIGRGDRVAMVLPNGPEMAAAFCAVVSGACCAPLNPAYGRDELEFYLSDLNASALVVPEAAETAAVAVAEARRIPVLRLCGRPQDVAGMFDLKLPQGKLARVPGTAEADDIALLLHTSGTTSRPKLVPLLHRNLCQSASNIGTTLGLTKDDRCLNVMPLFHIHGLAAALLASLGAGASVICTEGFHAIRFFQWMAECEPTWYTAVPTMHQALLARAERESTLPSRPLRFIRSSSAALPPKVMADLEELFGAPVVEAYGMTEAAHQMASNPLPPGTRKPGSVGLPAGPEIVILDAAGGRLSTGEQGEVAIRGANVTPGYERNEEANRQAFHDGWFRTGDQGYLDDQGYLFLTGRLKEIINRGGEKISPREVDEVLLGHPAIGQAVTFAVPHEQLGEDVGVAVILREAATLTEREVREYVAARLAHFKVPRVVKIVETIPKGPTGKLQRIGLAAKLGIEPIRVHGQSVEGETAAPRNPAEYALAEIWRDILGLGQIGIHDGFFALGGGSLQAVEMLECVRASGLGTVSVFELLEAPTVAGLAERLTRSGEKQRLPEGLLALQPTGSLPPLFCAPGHDGSLLGFAGLARHLGMEQPLIGFDPLHDAESGALSMNALAAKYLDRIREYQPAGPYRFLGVCFGGKVLLEAACQLQEQGEQVAFLGLINAFHPQVFPLPERLAGKTRNAWRRIRFHVGRMSGMRVREMLAYGEQRAQALLQNSIRPRLYQLAGNNRPRRSSDRRRVQSISMLKAWAPKVYSGPVMLIFDSVPRAGVYPSPRLGWEQFIPAGAGRCLLPDAEFNFWSDANTRCIAEVVKQSTRR